VVERATKKILCIAQDKGRTHDFSLYKKSIGGAIDAGIRLQADAGYQGIAEYHRNSETP
jgi:hypothetical protein